MFTSSRQCAPCPKHGPCSPFSLSAQHPDQIMVAVLPVRASASNAPLAALGLLVIILVAIATSGRQRIKLYKPIDEADRIDDWLYLPETLYAFMLIIVVSAGAGPYSLDALILGLMNRHVA